MHTFSFRSDGNPSPNKEDGAQKTPRPCHSLIESKPDSQVSSVGMAESLRLADSPEMDSDRRTFNSAGETVATEVGGQFSPVAPLES